MSVFETATTRTVARANATVRGSVRPARRCGVRSATRPTPADRPPRRRRAIASERPPPSWLPASSGCTGSITARRSGPRQTANGETQRPRQRPPAARRHDRDRCPEPGDIVAQKPRDLVSA